MPRTLEWQAVSRKTRRSDELLREERVVPSEWVGASRYFLGRLRCMWSMRRHSPSSTFRRVVPMLASFILSACGSTDDPPISCDAWAECYGEAGAISVNTLECRASIDDPVCGQAYRVWLKCYTDQCLRADADAGIFVCSEQHDALIKCRSTPRSDGAGE
jgi:hypothetical protein